MLLDTASLYYRAFYGMPETVTASDGTPVNAIRGLLDAIARLVREHRPARLVACLDADWRPAFRVAAIPGYKAHRAEPDGSEQTPPGLVVQIPLITQVLSAAGIALAEAAGYEADEIGHAISAAVALAQDAQRRAADADAGAGVAAEPAGPPVQIGSAARTRSTLATALLGCAGLVSLGAALVVRVRWHDDPVMTTLGVILALALGVCGLFYLLAALWLLLTGRSGLAAADRASAVKQTV